MWTKIWRSPSTKACLLIGLPFLLSLAANVMLAVAGAAAASALEPAGSQPLFAAASPEIYGKLPLVFEENRGQTNRQVKFVSRGRGYVLFLSPTETTLVLNSAYRSKDKASISLVSRQRQERAATAVLRMTLIGANSTPSIVEQDELAGKANYFIGNDRAKWRTNVPTYAKVRYDEVYPGIDLIFYGNQRQLEFDFVVAAGADPRRIVLAFQGMDKLELDAQGDLVLHTTAGPIHQRKPVVYQDVDGVRKPVPGAYVVKGTDRVGFELGAYDSTKPLIIDPVLFYSTYLGGSGSENGCEGLTSIAVDSSGNAYVVGTTASLDFPTTSGAVQPALAGGSTDAFVTKLNPTGSGFVYSTYLGGTSEENGCHIAVDDAGNAYVTGVTESPDFPTTTGALQTTYGGGSDDAFVTKLAPTGSALVYSTFLGGSALDQGFGIAVDSAGSAYIVGETQSCNFPTTLGAFQTSCSSFPLFVTKLNPAGSGLVYSTYFGSFIGAPGIAIDATGNAYVAGTVNAATLPTTVGAFQTTYGGGPADAFVTKFNSTGTGLVYSTYLGGTGRDGGQFGSTIAVDAAGSAYVTGGTDSTNFPTTLGAFQTALAGPTDAFVTKLNPLGTGLVYSTYLGGSGGDTGLGIAVDAGNNAYLTGATASNDFPTIAGAFQTTNASGGCCDAFITELNSLGTGLVYSTYLGGSGNDSGTGIALDTLPNPNAYVAGLTSSTDFPITPGAAQPTYGGGSVDAFVAKIANVVIPPGTTVGKVTGGGSIDVPDGIGTFGFIVQRQAADQSIRGDLQYVNHANGEKVHSVLFDMFLITGNTAMFHGTCTNNGVPCTFTVHVTDNGEPGKDDSFDITVDAGPTEGANEKLRSGNIKIHE